VKAQSIVKPKRPSGPGWSTVGKIMQTGYPNEGWWHQENGLMVISAVEVAKGIQGDEAVPQYHLSISKALANGQKVRCSAGEALWVLGQFDLYDGLEDNHSPMVRCFWRPVADHLSGLDCECKDHETPVTEGDFTWRPITNENAKRGDQ